MENCKTSELKKQKFRFEKYIFRLQKHNFRSQKLNFRLQKQKFSIAKPYFSDLRNIFFYDLQIYFPIAITLFPVNNNLNKFDAYLTAESVQANTQSTLTYTYFRGAPYKHVPKNNVSCLKP